MSRTLRIATRASEVGLRRARKVQAMLATQRIESEFVALRTSGDKHFEEWLPASGARTTFTKELETALTRDKADIAVHAYPDVSTDAARGVGIAAVLPRADPRDALVLNEVIEAGSMEELPRGTRVGTSSVRCRTLLLALHPHLEVVHLRGDLPTRLRKVDDGQVHATVVPAASLQLLDISQRIAAFLGPPGWLPAPAQGALVLRIRENDEDARSLLAPFDDARARLNTLAERALLAALEGGLQSPLGALVVDDGGRLVLHAVIGDLHGRRVLRAERAMDDSAPELVGIRVANELRSLGASDILDEMRAAQRIPAPQPE